MKKKNKINKIHIFLFPTYLMHVQKDTSKHNMQALIDFYHMSSDAHFNLDTILKTHIIFLSTLILNMHARFKPEVNLEVAVNCFK